MIWLYIILAPSRITSRGLLIRRGKKRAKNSLKPPEDLNFEIKESQRDLIEKKTCNLISLSRRIISEGNNQVILSFDGRYQKSFFPTVVSELGGEYCLEINKVCVMIATAVIVQQIYKVHQKSRSWYITTIIAHIFKVKKWAHWWNHSVLYTLVNLFKFTFIKLM